jgi:hypothetical protein
MGTKKRAPRANKKQPAKKPKAKKRKVGRPTKYKPAYCKQIVDYFQAKSDKAEFPIIEGFALEINIVKSTLHEWVKKQPEFSNAYKKAKYIQLQTWIDRSLDNTFKSPFTIFLGKNVFGWRDHVTLEGDSDKPLEVVVKWAK